MDIDNLLVMKKLIYIYISILLITGIIFSCDNEIEYPYQGKDCIYFDHEYEIHNGTQTVSFDSIVFSFGKKDNSIHQDTAKILVRVLGRKTKGNRTYKIRVLEKGTIIEDSTTAVEGVDYLKINELQTFSADSIIDTLRIVLNRDNLNTSTIAQESKKIILRLEPSEDFDLGINKGIEMKIVFNDFLSEPKWWKTRETYFNYYHPEKWKILMQWDDRFKDETKSDLGMTGNEMSTFARSLSDYLRENEVLDKETGARIYFDKIVN